MAIRLYTLDPEGNPVQVEAHDTKAWAIWYEMAAIEGELTIRRTNLPGCTVSTVFLSVVSSYGSSGAPLLWETMILGGPRDGYQKRYATRKEALRGHRAAVLHALTGLLCFWKRKPERKEDAAKDLLG